MIKRIPVIERSLGLNTVLDPFQPVLTEGASYLSKAVNVRITNSNVIERSNGNIKQLVLTAGHSGFCDGKDALVADGTSLYVLSPDGKSKVLIQSGLSGTKIDYQQVAEAIYFVNGTFNGIYHAGTVYSWAVEEYNGPDTEDEYETSVPLFDHICFHNGHMLGSIGNAVFSSQPGQFGLWRMQAVALMASKVLMMASVEDGVFISDQDKTEFFDGLDPFSWKRKPTVAFYPTIEWSLAINKLKAIDIGIEASGIARLWWSNKGLCVGTTGGIFKNLTEQKIVSPPGMSGGVLVRGFDVISTIG